MDIWMGALWLLREQFSLYGRGIAMMQQSRFLLPPPKIRGLGVNNPLSNHLFSRGPCRRSCHAPAVAFLLACKLSSTTPVSDFSTPPASFDSGLVFIHGQNNVVWNAWNSHFTRILKRLYNDTRVCVNHAWIKILTRGSEYSHTYQNSSSNKITKQASTHWKIGILTSYIYAKC